MAVIFIVFIALLFLVGMSYGLAYLIQRLDQHQNQ
ncbi:hypothetical protein HK1_01134 [Tepidibacillus sp. HK-1]|nr:hypothetical protein HK1_01134 [Tepidibacillus sp. HK-1]